MYYGPELLNVSIRRIRLNSRILLNKKNRRKFNLQGNRRVRLFRRNVKVQALCFGPRVSYLT